MRLFHQLPFSARHTYHYELRAAVLEGVYLGAGIGGAGSGFLYYVATRQVDVPRYLIAVLMCGIFVGMALAATLPGLLRARRKVAFVVSVQIVSKLCFMLLPLFARPWPYALLALLVLAGNSAFGSAYAGILRSNYPDSHRATIMGAVKHWQLLSLSTTALVVGALLRWNPGCWRWIFPVAGALGLWGTWMFSHIRARGELREIARGVGFGNLRLSTMWAAVSGNPRFLWYEVLFGLGGLPNIMSWQVNIILISDVLHASWVEIAWVTVISQVMMLSTYPVWGRILDRWKNPIGARALHVGIWAINPFCYALAYLVEASGRPHAIWLIYFGTVVVGAVMSGSQINWTLGVMHFCRREEVPHYAGFHHFLNFTRGLPGLLLGYLCWRHLGLLPTYLILSGMMVVAAVLLAGLYAYDQRHPVVHGAHAS